MGPRRIVSILGANVLAARNAVQAGAVPATLAATAGKAVQAVDKAVDLVGELRTTIAERKP